MLIKWLLITLSCFHFYTAGFGLLRETTHRGVHLAFVLVLIFLVFSGSKAVSSHPVRHSLTTPGGIPWFDWLLGLGVALAVLYIPYTFEDLAFRVGNLHWCRRGVWHHLVRRLAGSHAAQHGLATAHHCVGLHCLFAFWPVFPWVAATRRLKLSQFINHQYLTSQGIYGVAVGVVATYVFHFVLFGVIATRIGLGQLFLDIASSVAGRYYAGGPAKVSVFGSAMFGMLSGSSVANAVTVGSLTIPAMIRVGYQRHFAGAVEAAASTGGQITPPVLGAAAFLMIEFLGLPYQTIITAAIIPAFMHFFGVFMQVHFEAKRYGLRGLTEDEMPKLRQSLKMRWPTLIPLFFLISILVNGRTPYLAAFVGITSSAIVGLTTQMSGNTAKNWLLMVVLHLALMVVAFTDYDEMVKLGIFGVSAVVTLLLMQLYKIRGRIELAVLMETLETGAKYALAVGAAAATVGIVIGVVTLTGVGFKISFIITGAATAIANGLSMVIPSYLMAFQSLTLLAALVMTAAVCILMGAGIPTTANYIIMVTVAAPTLVQLGVEPLVAHFFVFYYGVLADITPPVALAAYAAAGMAGSDPSKPATPRSDWALPRLWCRLCLCFRPRCCWWQKVSPGVTSP